MDISDSEGLDNSKRYIALAICGKRLVALHTTHDSTFCSYGMQRWEDGNGNDYGQIDMPDIMVEFLVVFELPHYVDIVF